MFRPAQRYTPSTSCGGAWGESPTFTPSEDAAKAHVR